MSACIQTTQDKWICWVDVNEWVKAHNAQQPLFFVRDEDNILISVFWAVALLFFF